MDLHDPDSYLLESEDKIEMTTLQSLSSELNPKKISYSVSEQVRIEELERALEDYSRKLAKITDQLWNKDLEIEEKERQLRITKQNHGREMEALQESNTILNQQVNQVSADKTRIQMELAELLRKVRENEHRISTQKNELEQLNSRVIEQDQQLEQARDLIVHFEQALESSQVDLAKTKEDATVQLNESEHLYSQKLETALQQNKDLHAELAKSRNENSSLQTKTLELDRQIDDLRHKIEIQESQFSANQKKLVDWQAQLENREQNFRVVRESLLKEKTDLIRLAKQFVNEIQMAKSTHPFKDYLALTEGELNKLQSLHKSTLVHSSDRVQIEDGLSKLLKKREFLNSVISNSQKQLEERGKSLLELIQNM